MPLFWIQPILRWNVGEWLNVGRIACRRLLVQLCDCRAVGSVILIPRYNTPTPWPGLYTAGPTMTRLGPYLSGLWYYPDMFHSHATVHCMHGSWCIMHGSRYMVHGAWYMVYDAWCMHGTWWLYPYHTTTTPHSTLLINSLDINLRDPIGFLATLDYWVSRL